MKIVKNKIAAITIATFFMLSMTASMALVPSAKAHTPALQIPTYAFINVAPNPAGIGQTVTVGFWLDITPPTASGATGDRWHNFKVTVTLPDGTTTTLGPFTSDDTGGTFTTYTPTQLGNYSFVFTFPGQTLTGENGGLYNIPGNAYVGDYFEPSTSPKATLTVQQSAIPSTPQTPLPTSYWSTPIESVNDLWYTISGNWLGFGALSFANTGMYNITGNYNPYSSAPMTAHILWTKPVAFGGLMGGEFGGTSMSNYYSSSQYEPKFAPIIMNGVLYYTMYPGSATSPAGWAAVNLHTGQTIWTKNTTDILRCGQILDYVSPNQFGGIAYLWATDAGGALGLSSNPAVPYVPITTYRMYDAMTGNLILSIVNATAMTLTEDQGGDLIGYYVTVTNAVPGNPYTPVIGEKLNMWNSTQAILYPSGYTPGVTVANWMWRPAQGSVIDFSKGIVWSVPLPLRLNGVPLPTTFSITTVNSGVVLLNAGTFADLASFFNTGFAIQAGYNANTGAQLWITNRTLDIFARDQFGAAGNGDFFMIDADQGTLTAYSMTTGNIVWGPTALTGTNGVFPVPNPYDSSGGYVLLPANGVLYTYGFGGDIWAINMATGAIIWYTSTNTLSGLAGSDTPYGVWPLWIFSSESIAGGVLFINEGHEYSPPLFRGANQLAINITDGKLIWSILSFDVTNPMTLSDGIGTVLNAYDNQIYAYGMGPTKTTVAAPSVGVTTAMPVTISGTVTDISAGSQQEAVAANFPNGLPCVSDASMSQFMESVYMQQPEPHNVTGVPVTLSVLDSNGNYRTIGATTTNGLGDYGFTWKPDIPGNYTIYATFAGSASYYPSTASTFFYAASPAPTAAPTATPLTGVATQNAVMYIGIAIIVVIVIIGAVLAILVTRKRP